MTENFKKPAYFDDQERVCTRTQELLIWFNSNPEELSVYAFVIRLKGVNSCVRWLDSIKPVAASYAVAIKFICAVSVFALITHGFV